MTSQPPLLDPMGADLPSPLFTPRPGWGGKLSRWLRENLYILVFRLVVFGAVALIIFSLIRSWQTPQTAQTLPSPSSLPLSQNWTFQTDAERGQGMTHLSAWAIDTYLTQHIPKVTLTAVEHLYSVDTLAHEVGWRHLEVGEHVTFSADDIAVIIEHAKSLSPAQRAAWSKLLR